MIQAFPIDETFEVVLDSASFSAESDISERVAEIWRLATADNQALFDGSTLCTRKVTMSSLVCTIVPYRFVYGQIHDSMVAQTLNLEVACVSGITLLADKVLYGRRASKLSQCGGLLELVPSGSLSPKGSQQPINYRTQLLEELVEETGIRCDQVDSVEPFLIVRDTNHNVIDICCKIRLHNLTPNKVTQLFRSGEYSQLLIEPLANLQILAQKQQDWVPTSAAIIKALHDGI